RSSAAGVRSGYRRPRGRASPDRQAGAGRRDRRRPVSYGSTHEARGLAPPLASSYLPASHRNRSESMMQRRTRAAFVPALAALALSACAADQPRQEPADLVLRSGHVVTVDSTRPEVEAVAIRGYEIVAVGSDDEIAAYIS